MNATMWPRIPGADGAMVRAACGIVCVALACLPTGAAEVSLADDAAADLGELLVVPLTIDPVDQMLAIDIDVAYDPRYLEALSVDKTALLESFTLTTNLTEPGWVRISLFGTSTISGGGEALEITFETLQAGCSLLDVVRATLNEGELPAEIDDGNAMVRDLVDRDGDGVSEAGGDCSDRFDWIHPGAPEVCNGADDDCDGSIDGPGVCVCPGFPAPRRVSFWLAACRGSNLEEQIDPAYVDLVNDSATFTEISTVAEICEVLGRASSEICVEAERAFMALELNIASERLCGTQPIVGGTSGELEVQGVAAVIDGLLSDPLRTSGDCAEALVMAEEIDTGEVIPHFLSEEIALVVSREGGDRLVLAWEEPDASAAGRPTVFRIHRCPALPPAWSERGETLCSSWFPEWNVSGGAGSSLYYQVSGSAP